MRRTEFKITDKAQIDALLNETNYGTLACIDTDGLPCSVPLNFVYVDEKIYFHGSKNGKKADSLAKNPNVAFSVVKEYAFIPSYFGGSEIACPATQYFKSVMVFGMAYFVEEMEQKCEALTKLMQKMQPEGGYEEINYENKKYQAMLDATSVVAIEPSSVSAKFKFGQNASEEKIKMILESLETRTDKITIEEVVKIRSEK